MSEIDIISYVASPTASEFHLDDSFVRSLLGPIGSGKSVACIMDLVAKAFEQAPNTKGVRKTRWAVIRNTYRELIDTTVKTFFDWVPEEAGEYVKLDMTFTLYATLPDGTEVESEFLFRALDKPKDVKKLLSLELTGAFLNEAREIPKAVFDMVQGRVGRYPSKRDGGPTWFGVILDTNPPDDDGWFYKLFEEGLPPNFRIWKQPSGLSPQAENIENLPPGYYTNLQFGKTDDWVKVYIHGEYGYVSDGKPIYPEYKDNVHYIDAPDFEPVEGLPIYIGIDFGLTPAATFAQKLASGQVVYFDELVTFDMGAVSFADLLRQKIGTQYIKWKDNLVVTGDPAGEQRSQVDEKTPFMILANHGIHASPAYTNDYTIRRESMATMMQKLDFSGNPAFLVTGNAPTLRKALNGGYKYKRLQVIGEDKFMDKPDKNKYSHVAEAAQYNMLAMVGGDMVVGGFKDSAIDYSKIDNTIV